MSDNMLNKIKLKLVLICHALLVCFVVISPFINSNYVLLMHAVIVPFIMFHWIVNNDTCALTMMEKKLRQKITGKADVKEDCFTCKIIEPVYNFKNNYKAKSRLIYLFTTILTLISMTKLFGRYKCGKIRKFQDIFIV
jgi:hypothetical protein